MPRDLHVVLGKRAAWTIQPFFGGFSAASKQRNCWENKDAQTGSLQLAKRALK